MHCGKTLMLLRKYKNRSQVQLAKKLETSQQYISELEKREHLNGKLLDKVLQALNSNRNEWNQFRKLPPRLKIET